MDCIVKFRAGYSSDELETRAVHCFDGVIRLITFENQHWKKLDFLLSLTDECDLKSITKLCIESIRTKNKVRFEQIFYGLFWYYIYSCHHAYDGRRNDIANQYWKPLHW